MKLITYHYSYHQNHIIGQCDSCGEIVNGLAADVTVLKCRCGKTEFDKLPLHYLINNNPTMTLFLATHKASGKQFVGFTFDGSSSSYKSHMKQEMKNIMRRNTYPELAKDIKEYGLDSFKLEPLAFPQTTAQAAIQEKLHINMKNTMEPEGYNTCYVLEIINKPINS